MFVVDDHAIVRAGIIRVLVAHPAFLVVGEASSAPEALRLLRDVSTDVVLVDLALQRGSGLDLLHALRDEMPLRRALVVTMHDEALYAERAIRAGARGFIGKDTPVEDLYDAILTVSRGELSVSPRLRDQLLLGAVGATPSAEHHLDALTDRELDVLRLLGLGLTTRQIAERLGISNKTVETHRINIKSKLRIQTIGELIRFSMQRFGGAAPP